MAKPLSEYFGNVEARDIANYNYGKVEDFLESNLLETWDWIITNPPFKLAEDFILQALEKSKIGCAFLVRTTFIESIGRYERLFSKNPPTKFAQFVERVPMVKGRLDRRVSTATGYCWLVWIKKENNDPQLVWIPPCRKKLELLSDYPNGQIAIKF